MTRSKFGFLERCRRALDAGFPNPEVIYEFMSDFALSFHISQRIHNGLEMRLVHVPRVSDALRCPLVSVAHKGILAECYIS